MKVKYRFRDSKKTGLSILAEKEVRGINIVLAHWNGEWVVGWNFDGNDWSQGHYYQNEGDARAKFNSYGANVGDEVDEMKKFIVDTLNTIGYDKASRKRVDEVISSIEPHEWGGYDIFMSHGFTLGEAQRAYAALKENPNYEIVLFMGYMVRVLPKENAKIEDARLAESKLNWKQIDSVLVNKLGYKKTKPNDPLLRNLADGEMYYLIDVTKVEGEGPEVKSYIEVRTDGDVPTISKAVFNEETGHDVTVEMSPEERSAFKGMAVIINDGWFE